LETTGLAFAEPCVPIRCDADIVVARQRVRALAIDLGFLATDATMLATAVSELARNILLYAVRGEVAFDAIRRGGRDGIQVIARDAGPGIRNVPRALEAGFSTSGGLGLGLPGVRRLADDFEIASNGHGTVVTIRKWVRS